MFDCAAYTADIDYLNCIMWREACISFKELCFEKEKDNLWADELEALRQSQFASMPNNGIILTAETDKTNIDGNDQNAGSAPDLQGTILLFRSFLIMYFQFNF